MPFPNRPARRARLRKLVVVATLIGLMPQILGCAGTQTARRPAVSEVPAAATATASEQVSRAAPQRAESPPVAPRRTWKGSKLRKALRRGSYATEEGTKEAARIAGIAALCTVAAAAFGALLYLDLTQDNDAQS
jgi:hypothetical protein